MSRVEDASWPPYLANEEALDAFLHAFHDGTFPIASWTHGAHVAMAASVLWTTPIPRALAHIREAIRHYNVSQGGANTETSGYHETLTRLWLGAIAATMAANAGGGERLESVRNAYRAFARRAAMFAEWYSVDLIRSTDARREWVPPSGDAALFFGVSSSSA